VTRDVCIQFGRTIRVLRIARGWRQIDLAQEAGINEKYVSDLELGRKEICLRMIAAIADAFDMSIAELFQAEER